MANFLAICEWVLRQEDSTLSGKVVNLMDGQGRTRFGIGEVANPQMPPDFYTTMDVQYALLQAEQQYRLMYWNRFWGDQITDEGVASCLLSFSINDGISREVKMLQKILMLPTDGIMGPITLQVANARNGSVLAAALRQAQMDFYKRCVINQPTDTRFLTGWLKRASLVYPNLS